MREGGPWWRQRQKKRNQRGIPSVSKHSCGQCKTRGCFGGTPWSPPSTPCGETQKASILGLGFCVSCFLLGPLQQSPSHRVAHPMSFGQQIPSRTLTKAPSLSLPQVPGPGEAELLAPVTQVAGGRGDYLRLPSGQS